MSGTPRLGKVKREILACLSRGPRTAAQITDYVWQLHPQDKPACPANIRNHISQMRKLLAATHEFPRGPIGHGMYRYSMHKINGGEVDA